MLRKLIVIVFLLCVGTPSVAQWQNVAPGLMGSVVEYGHVSFKSGILWAGVHELWMSMDTGRTWTKTNFGNHGHINYTEFFDKATGLIATDAGAFLTRDQGATWKNFSFGSSCSSVGFGQTSNDLVYCEFGPAAVIRTSQDGGISWTMYSGPGAAVMHRRLNNGSTAVFSISRSQGGTIQISPNFGGSWTVQPGKTKWDAFNFTTDPCDDHSFYVVNEEYYTQTDGYSQIYFSSDLGATWLARPQHQTPYYSASLVATHAALYAGTNQEGIQRSKDQGLTWHSIGGPNGAPDTRGLCAINDNLLFAIDSFGSIWRTLNSGGDPIHATLETSGVSIQNPFRSTIGAVPSAMCDAFDTVLRVFGGGCSSQDPKLLSATLTGNPDFTLPNLGQLPRDLSAYDSISIHFTGNGDSLESARLSLRLQIGSDIIDTILPLNALGAAARLASTFSDGTLHAIAKSKVRFPVSASLPRSLGIASLKVKSISFALTYDESLLSMDAINAKQLVGQRSLWGVQSAQVTNGTLRVVETNDPSEKLTDSLYLATPTFTALFSNANSTAVHLSELTISTDSNELPLCIGFEGGYVVNVVVGPASVSCMQAKSFSVSHFPDPVRRGATHLAKVVLERPADIVVTLFDVLGRESPSVIKMKLSAGQQDIVLPAETTSGTHYLRIESDGEVITQKFIVE